MKTVAVYGSSTVQAHESDYQAAHAVGKAIGAAGFAVMTGGYAGVMEAVSRGAAETNGHVIGVTTDIFANRRGDGTHVNPWVAEEIRHPTLRERLLHLVLEADAYVCMPGGLGTMHELITVWELMRVGDIPPRPLICYGDYWTGMLETMRQSPYVKQNAWSMLEMAHSPQDVVNLLQKEP